MTSAQTLIDETKRHLLSGEREVLNRLNGAINNSTTSVVFEFAGLGGIVAGAVIEIDAELMYVWSVSTVTATVQRGMFGSTAASHSDDAIITVNPRFPAISIVEALNHELIDMSSPMNGLFAVDVELLTASSGTTGYDLSLSNFISPIEVHYEAGETEKWWKRATNWRVVENANTTDFTSGRALMLSEATPIAGGEIRLTYRKYFSAITSATADVETTSGISANMIDIPPLGAAARLMMHRGSRRVFDEGQGEPRRASEVNETAILQVASALLAMRDRRINAEHARLKALYPTRLRDA